jgi:hypothetical protein
MRVNALIITVAGTIWTTGNILLATVAVMAFRWQREHVEVVSREGVGAIFGVGLVTWSGVISFLLLPLLIALGLRCGSAWRGRRRIATALWFSLMVTTWAVHAVNHQSTTQANQQAAAIRELRMRPNTEQQNLPALEQQFAALHHASERWHGLETVLALGIAICGCVLLLRRESPAETSPVAEPA